MLTLGVTPAGGGTLSADPNPGLNNGYFASGASVKLTAAASSGYFFAGFAGDLAGTATPQNTVMSAPRTVTAQFAKTAPSVTLLPAQYWQRAEIVDFSGRAGVMEFRPGEKNVLVIPGFGSSGVSEMSGVIDSVSSQCANVMAYKYSSGTGVREAGRLLIQILSRILPAGVRFDVVAYDMGGLVARAAVEQSDLTGGLNLADRVDTLVTIATPHKGFPQTIGGRETVSILGLPKSVPGLRDLYENSDLLAALNAGQRSTRIRYFAIAGNKQTATDGLVGIDSALGAGILDLAGQATVPLGHSARIAASPVFPNDEQVYALLKQWIFADPILEPATCVSLDGNWRSQESATENCTIEGIPEKPQTYSGSTDLNMTPTGACSWRFQVDTLHLGQPLARDAVVAGRQVTISGKIAMPVPGVNITFTDNLITGSGRVCGHSASLSTTGKLNAVQDGHPIACTYTGTFAMSKSGGVSSAALTAVSTASLMLGALAPGSAATLYGSNLAAAFAQPSGPDLPATLGETSVRVADAAGDTRDALLFFASPAQINLLLPSGTAQGPATLTVLRLGREGATPQTMIDTVAPGLFTANQNGEGLPAATLDRIAAGGARSSILVYHQDPLRGVVPTAIAFGPEGDQIYLTLYGTGFRGRDTNGLVAAFIDGVSVPVLYAGPQPSYPGLDQVNLGPLPRTLTGRGEVPLVLEFGSVTTNTVTLAFAE